MNNRDLTPVQHLRLSLTGYELSTFIRGGYPLDDILALLDAHPLLLDFDLVPGKAETTALVLAIEMQNLLLVSVLLERGARPVDRAVMEATRLGRLDVVRALKEKGASLLNTALGEVRYLVQAGAPVELGDRYGATPLIRSCWAKRFDVVRYLLCEAGCSPLTRAKSGESPLLALLRDSKCTDAELMADTVRLLLEKGADPDACDKTYLRAPLHVVETGEVALLLLQSGANIEAVEHTQLSPLGNAVENGSLGVMAVLQDHGASVAHQDEVGNTPLHLVPDSKNLSLSGKIEAARMLLVAGSDPTQLNRASMTPRSVLTRSLRFTHPDLPVFHGLLKEAEDTVSLVHDLYKVRLVSLVEVVLTNPQSVPPAIASLLEKRDQVPQVEFTKQTRTDSSSSHQGADVGLFRKVLQSVASWSNDGHFTELISFLSPYHTKNPKGVFRASGGRARG